MSALHGTAVTEAIGAMPPQRLQPRAPVSHRPAACAACVRHVPGSSLSWPSQSTVLHEFRT